MAVYDNDPDMVNLFKRYVQQYRKGMRYYHIESRYMDSNYPFVSHGVLEHMNDKEIDKEFKRPKFYYYVPTDGYSAPSFGDERLMSARWWVKRSKSSYFVFNQGKDLILFK